MLNDLRRYITNDIEYSGAILFFYKLCQRTNDNIFLIEVLNKLASGLDDAIDAYKPSYWITRIADDIQLEDYFGLSESFIIEMILKCFHVAYDCTGYSDDAFIIWCNHRFTALHDQGIKKPNSNFTKLFNEFLSELDYEFKGVYKEALKKKLKEYMFEQESYIRFYCQEIKLLNKCNQLKELENILFLLGFIKASNGQYFWASWYYEYGYDYEESTGFGVSQELIDCLNRLPIHNDLSEYDNLFQRMEFEENNGLNALINKISQESFNMKDVIF